MLQKTMAAVFLAIGSGLIAAGPVLAAGDTTGDMLPGPGVLGLVAAGIIGTIALAKLRK